MPELPDVVGLERCLADHALDLAITRISVPDERVLADTTPGALGRRLDRRQFAGTRRRGKFLFAELDDDSGALILHFGMTGTLDYGEGTAPDYTKFVVHFENGKRLAYICRRMLGLVGFTADVDAFIADRELGPDALDESLDAAWFLDTLAGRRGMIKPLLMNQNVIAGIGNVYSDEMLWRARLDPRSTAGKLDEDTARDLWASLLHVLGTAAEHGGDLSKVGSKWLAHYRDEDAECPRCGGGIQRIEVSGRGAYMCPDCQESVT